MARFEKHRIIWQVLLLWGGWLLITFSLTNGFENLEKIFMRAIPSLLGVIIIVQVNSRYLFPRLFIPKKHSLFVLAGVVLLTLAALLLHHEFFPWTGWYSLQPPPMLEELKGRPGGSGVRWMGRVTPLVIAFLGSTLVEITRFANIKEKEAIRSEKEKLGTELKFLKSQVNPHFLFNALNNIYSLAVVQAPQTPESVMQLSEILRYMVYDSNKEKVPLKSEINYIENFVDLKLLKDSRGMDIELDLDKTSDNLMVAPLLLIPFVENAFKHSKIENLKSGYIKIKLKVEDRTIVFQVVNSIPENNFTKDQVGGVGLENTKKRLDLLYPDNQHQLEIKQTSDQFEVFLKITV